MSGKNEDAQARRQIVFFCIGAQKAGTTWLQQRLEGCADVFLARPKELHYWDCIRAPYMQHFALRAQARLQVPQPGDPLPYRLSALWRPSLRARKHLAERYAGIYAAGPENHAPYLSYLGLGRVNQRLIGDITPSYALLGRNTFAEMLACHDDVRFLFIMRDPVDRLWSGLKQHYRSALASGKLGEEGLHRRFKSVCRTPLDPNYLRSDYPATLTELEAVVPQKRIHYSFFETLLDAEAGVAERTALANFLGVPQNALDIRKKVHASTGSFRPPPDLQRLARRTMEPIYVEMSRRFTNRLPAAWASIADI